MKSILSRDNPLIKRVRALAHGGRDRRKLGQTVIDGAHLVAAALDAGLMPREVLLSAHGASRPEHTGLCAQLPSDVLVAMVPDALFAQLSPVESPSGMLAVIDIPVVDQALPGGGDVLVLDAVQDAGNLGTLLRTAGAAGLRHAVLTSGCAQAWAPRVLRAAMGAHFLLQIHEQADAESWLATYAGRIFVTALGEGSRSIYEADLRGESAWVFGAEGAGVSAALMARATDRLIIPMPGTMESLNVAAAAAICLFEQIRQRHAS
jgi:TrmH family RNA methyltransferase